MNQYTVVVVDTITRYFKVEAENEEDAREEAEVLAEEDAPPHQEFCNRDISLIDKED